MSLSHLKHVQSRAQRGHTLDGAYTEGCNRLFQELALAIHAQAGIDLRFTHLDTTNFSHSGEDVSGHDEQARTMPPGYTKDHRSDLKQAVLARLVSQDGGVPIVSQSGDGNPFRPPDVPGTRAGLEARLHEPAQLRGRLLRPISAFRL